MLELKDKLLNRMGVAEAMGHRATESARRLQQAAYKHHDATNAEIADLAKQIEAKGVGQDEELEQRYCRALVTRSHMTQAGHLAQQDAGKMPEVGGKLEKGRLAKLEAAGQGAMNFDEQEHPRAEEGSNGQYKPGEFVPKEQRQEAAQKADEAGFPGLADAHANPKPKEAWELTKEQFESDPDLVYHGGRGDYKIQADRGGTATGNATSDFGAFFTPHPEEAQRYVKGFHGGKGMVHKVKLNLKKPHHMSFEEFGRISEVDWNKLGVKGGMEEIRRRVREVKSNLMAGGYDGIIVGEPGHQAGNFPTALANGERSPEIIAFHDDSIVQHRYAVEQALAEGKEVPPEVLADYPDLKKKEETPEEDWKKNGVRSKSFKSWFGDWETDPENASKVLNEKGEPAETAPITASEVKDQEGRPRVVYHGTARGGFSSFDPSKTDAEALYGPGFYFTEDPEIAEEYQSKGQTWTTDQKLTGAHVKRAKAMVDEIKAKRRKLEDESRAEPETPEFEKLLRDSRALYSIGEAARMGHDSLVSLFSRNNHPFVDEFAEKLGLKRTPAGKAEVFPVYLNIRQPFDIEGGPDDATKARIETAMRGAGMEHKGIFKKDETGDQLFRRLSDACLFARSEKLPGTEEWRSPKEGAVKILQAAGYDGLTHTGGQVVGGGDHLHKVWIAFDPGQVKSAGNEGTFDPANPDIRKALPRPFVPPDMPRWRNGRPEGDAYLPLNGVEDREKFRAMVEEMTKGTWTWDKPLIRCGDQLLTGSHRYAAAKVAGVPLELMDVDDLFKQGGLDFKATWEVHAQPWTGWLSNMDFALKCLPVELLAHYGVDLG